MQVLRLWRLGLGLEGFSESMNNQSHNNTIQNHKYNSSDNSTNIRIMITRGVPKLGIPFWGSPRIRILGSILRSP